MTDFALNECMRREWRMNFKAVAIALALTGSLVTGRAALATEFCVIKSAKDGFVALRAKPARSGKLLARMQPEDEVQLLEGQSGPWQKVMFWRDDTRTSLGYDKPTAIGWVHGSLIGDCG